MMLIKMIYGVNDYGHIDIYDNEYHNYYQNNWSSNAYNRAVGQHSQGLC